MNWLACFVLVTVQTVKIVSDWKREYMKLYKIISCIVTVSLVFGSLWMEKKPAMAAISEEMAVTAVGETEFFIGKEHKKETEVSAKRQTEFLTEEEYLAQGIKAEQGNAAKTGVLARVRGNSSSYGRELSYWVNTNGEAVQISTERDQLSFSRFSKKEKTLPDSFDLRKEKEQGKPLLPSVQNQEAYGTCWAMAGLAAVESNILRKGLPYRQSWLTDGELKFSTAHLGWYLFESPQEGDGISGDYLERPYKGADGGDYMGVIAALAAGEGVQLEKNAPYSNWNYGQSAGGRYTSYYQLENADFLGYAMTQEARNAVKQWIVSGGAVECGLYFSMLKKEECYYQKVYDASYANHEVILVGWDDQYSKENFEENGSVPEYDGAWIAQNSYGTEWGEEGYFYISYEEPSLGGFINYEMKERGDGEACYQYDGAGGCLGISSAALSSAANVFTSVEKEELREIGISLSELNSSGADYQVEIYKWKGYKPQISAKEMINTGDLQKEKLPKISEETHVKEAETEGTFLYPGYHRITLKTPVSLEEGECFAVVLTLSPVDRHSEVYYSFEGTINNYDMEEFHYGVEKGQTYFLKGFGEQAEWKDAVSIKKETDGFTLGNLNLKAFTYSENRAGDTVYQEQKAQLEEMVKTTEEFLKLVKNSKGVKTAEGGKSAEMQRKEFGFTQGNTIFNEELLSFLEEQCRFAKETLLLQDGKVYELENASNSLSSAMEYMKYPAEEKITSAEELYRLSEQMAELTMNARKLVSIENDLVMNPSSSFQFGTFDTEQDQKDKGVIQKVLSPSVKIFKPLGGRGGAEFTLEGNGHSISGMVCAETEEEKGEYIGLIGLLAGGGSVQNLTIKDSYIEGNFCVGAFAGALAYGGTIKKCRIRNTFVRGCEQFDKNGSVVPAYHAGGLAGLVTAYCAGNRSGIYDSKIKESLIYGQFMTGGIVGSVHSGGAAGKGNVVQNSSVVGIAAYTGSRCGVGLYLGGEKGNEDDAGNQADLRKQFIFTNSSAAAKDYLLINLYKPKNSTDMDEMLLFIGPYQKSTHTLKSVLLQGTAKKKKRGDNYFQDGWSICGMAGDITVTPMAKRVYQVGFYSSLTGKCMSQQSVVRGTRAESVKAPLIKGYRFLGWYDRQTGEKFHFKEKVTKDYELAAIYKKSK